jgi:hypothetical protein
MRQQTVYTYPPGHSATPTITERSLSKMRNDTAASGEFRINLPADVLAEARRNTTGSPRAAMQVDGFRPGLFGRLIGLFTGRRR